MQHRYESNSNSSSISSAGHHGAFLGTAREKRDRLLRRAYLNQQRNGTNNSWQTHSPPPPSLNDSFPAEYRYFRHHPSSRTHSVDGILSSPTNSTAASGTPLPTQNMGRTISQNSLNIHRSSPCPSDISFSFSNPKYFVRSAFLRPATLAPRKSPMHYENVLVSPISASHRSFNDQSVLFDFEMKAVVITERSTTYRRQSGRGELSFPNPGTWLHCSA